MADSPFTFLTLAEFERLNSTEKVAYLRDAIAELAKDRIVLHGWDSLFTPAAIQQQQQPRPKPSDPKLE